MGLSSPWLRPQPRLSDALEANYTKSRFVLARKSIKEHMVELEKTLRLNSGGREIWRLKNIKIYFTYIQTHVDHAISIRDKEVQARIGEKAKVDEENVDLRVKNHCLRVQNEELEAQNKYLETQNKDIGTQKEHLETQHQSLAAWKQFLDVEKQRLEHETSRLLQANEQLTSYNQTALGANQALRNEINGLQSRNWELDQDNNRTKATNQQLLAQLGQEQASLRWVENQRTQLQAQLGQEQANARWSENERTQLQTRLGQEQATVRWVENEKMQLQANLNDSISKMDAMNDTIQRLRDFGANTQQSYQVNYI